MGWTGEHRGFVVEAYYENNRSVIAMQRAFRTRFALVRNASVPDWKKILLWISNLWATGSTLKRKSPGRPRTVRTPENVEAVRASNQQSPKRSARKHAMPLGISGRSLRRILHADLKLHPYKIMLAQELSERDHANRRAISTEILEQVPAAALLLSSDEAHFHISGAVNKQNFRYWAESNPHELQERPLHSPRVTVWCAVADFGVIGTYFFEEGGATVIVTADWYVEILGTFLRPRLDDFDTEHVVSTGRGHSSHSTTFTWSVEGNVPWAFDLFKGRRGVAGTVIRFKPMWLSPF